MPTMGIVNSTLRDAKAPYPCRWVLFDKPDKNKNQNEKTQLRNKS